MADKIIKQKISLPECCRFLVSAAIAAVFLSGCTGDFMNCHTARDVIHRDKDSMIADLSRDIKEIESNEEIKTRSLTKIQSLYFQLGTQYLDKNMWDMALSAFSNSVKYGKKDTSVYYSLGVAYANRGAENKNSDDLDMAGHYYEKTLALDQSHYEASYGLAILLFFEKNEKERALSIMKDTVAKHNKFYAGRFGLGRFYYEMKQPGKALSVYRELEIDLAKLPDSQDIRIFREHCRENIQRIESEQEKIK